MIIVLPKPSISDRAKIAALVNSGKLLPVLNDTKWSELISEMRCADSMRPQFRLRSVLTVRDHVTDWDGEWHYHIHPVEEIEWVELQAASEQWLIAVLRKHSIPFSIENGTVRVWGYTRPGAQPRWA